MMQVDVQRLLDFIPYCANLLWSSPFQVIVCVALLWRYVGVACLAGLATILAILPINMWAMGELEKVQKSNMIYKDQRVRAVSELLSGIRVLKLFSWERPARDKVMGVRGEEVRALRRFGILGALQGVLWSSTTAFVALATFGTYVSLGNRLTLDVALPVLSLITILQFPLAVLPWMFISSISFRIALGRLQKFLLSPSIVDRRRLCANSESSTDEPSPVVSFDKVSLEWTGGKSVLQHVCMQVERGSIIALVGAVGAGKTTLLSALLGELEMSSGRVSAPEGVIAYVPQEPWIFNASLRDNILVGSPWDRDRYNNAVEVTGLAPDLEILPAGDLTEIGERGINLSGGQKQRVCLARAVYSGSGLFVLDDPLSAVDSHVAQHIFDKCIMGAMAASTRVLVTHRVDLIRNLPHIVVLAHGTVAAQGTYAQLVAQGVDMGVIEEAAEQDEDVDVDMCPESQSSTAADSHHQGAAENDGDAAGSNGAQGVGVVSRVPSAKSAKSAGAGDEQEKAAEQEEQQLIKDEERETGLVNPETYKAYLDSVGKEMLITVMTLGAASQLARVLIGWWISRWAADDSLIAPEADARRVGHMPALYAPAHVYSLFLTGASFGASMGAGLQGAAAALQNLDSHDVRMPRDMRGLRQDAHASTQAPATRGGEQGELHGEQHGGSVGVPPRPPVRPPARPPNAPQTQTPDETGAPKSGNCVCVGVMCLPACVRACVRACLPACLCLFLCPAHV